MKKKLVHVLTVRLNPKDVVRAKRIGLNMSLVMRKALEKAVSCGVRRG